MTCGVTVTLLVTLLFFLVNRLRQRKSQAQESQLAMDDQRSMDGIGFIGGNIGYLGAGTMDYSYEHGTTHYQFWKPPGSYFTRRDAPPPYEEAIALAMTESSNTCTVSVASSNLCQYPMALMEANPGRNVTASTTNLINININNGENTTTTATGEHHNSEPDSNILTRTSGGVHIADDFKTNHELNMSFPTINYNITAGTSNVCTNQNCDLRSPKRVETESVGTHATISSMKHVELKNNVDNHVKLPTTELRSSGKQYHRTIPKHFSVEGQIQSSSKNALDTTAVDVNNAISTNEYANKNNFIDLTFNGVKRLSCQCPVKHTPISNISSYAIGIDQTLVNEMDVPTSSDKGAYNIKNSAAQAAYRTSKNHELSNYEGSSCRTKQCHYANNVRNKGNTSKNFKYYDESIKKDFSNNSYCNQQLDSQICKEKTSEHVHDYASKSFPLTTASMVKAGSSTSDNANRDCISTGVDISMNIAVIQRSSSVSNEELAKHKKKMEPRMEQNPELPPKQYKYSSASTRLSQHSYYSNSKIHTISKPTKDNAKFSIHTSDMNGVFKPSENSYTKSLPRNAVHNKGVHMKNYNSRKTATQHHNNYERSSKNGKFNTLSKEYNKTNTRGQNMLTEVVSKIPSVINIPSPLLPETLKSLEQCAVDSTTKPSLSRSKMGKLKHDNLQCNKKSTIATSTNSLMNESTGIGGMKITATKDIPSLATATRCDNSKKHFITHDNSLDDEYLSECENCKSAHSSRYYLEEEIDDGPQETMTLQRKMPENEEDQQNYYRISSTLPTNTNKKMPIIKNRESWFTTIPASSSSDEEETEGQKGS